MWTINILMCFPSCAYKGLLLGISDDRNLEVTVKGILCQSIFSSSSPTHFTQQLFLRNLLANLVLCINLLPPSMSWATFLIT